jgi:N-acetylglucosamine-6-sulfatase
VTGRAALFVVAAWLLAAQVGVAPLARAASPAQPNIVVIMTDDQRVDDLYARSGAGELMPKTRKLIGAAGVSFARSYASYPLSCPSRSTFLTGRYAHNHGITANVFPGYVYCGRPGIFPAEDSLGPWLHDAGYFTVLAGRYLNGYPSPIDLSRTLEDPGWDRWYTPVTVGIEKAAVYFGYWLNDNGGLVPPIPATLPEDSTYFTDVIVDRAVSSIESAPHDRPLFLYLSHRAPHEDDDAPEGPRPADRDDLFAQALGAPRLPSFNERDLSDKPPAMAGLEPLSPGERRQAELRAQRRRASLRAVDDGVGEVVDALRRSGRLGNTYVFFTSDNGLFLGEHRLPKGKLRAYEESARVPLMVAGPGVAAGKVSRELVANVDLAPTILGLAGARPTTPLDGRSLLPFLRSPGTITGRPLLLESYRDESPEVVGPNPRVAVPPYHAIVRGRYKLVLFETGQGELYDLKRDPHELENVYADPAYANARVYLTAELRRLRRCLGASCRAEIPEPAEPSGGKSR